MKKVELLNSIAALNTEFKLPKEYKNKLEELLAEYKSSASTKEEHPPVKDDKGNIIEVWCNKHLQYEPVEKFATSTKSKYGYHNKCKLADYQWKYYLSQIKDADAKLSKALDDDDFELAAKLNKEKKQLIITKDGAYPTEEELSPEQLEDILPKHKEA